MKKMHINATTFFKLDRIKFSVEYERVSKPWCQWKHKKCLI